MPGAPGWARERRRSACASTIIAWRLSMASGMFGRMKSETRQQRPLIDPMSGAAGGFCCLALRATYFLSALAKALAREPDMAGSRFCLATAAR